MSASRTLLRARRLSRSFSGVPALLDVDFDIRPAEVHGLVGQNGAGKSTLIKLLAGVLQPDSGSIELDGGPVSIPSAKVAGEFGIAVLHQDLNLVPSFTVAENISLGLRPPRRLGCLIHWRAVSRRAARVLAALDCEIDPGETTGRLSPPQQQLVAIARALMLDARIVIMDEPTAALGAHEAQVVFDVVERLRDRGCGVVYVSHRLEEVAALADRVTILRDGRRIETLSRGEVTSHHALVRLITGRDRAELVSSSGVSPGEIVLSARHLQWQRRVADVSLELRRGEVTGLAGLVGSGRSELAGLLFGSMRPDGGEIVVHGRVVARPSPKRAIASGVALIPEDRRGQGAHVDMTVRENLTLGALDRFRKGPFISRRKEREAFRLAVKALSIVATGPEARLSHLSGGNQQKVVIAKWLATEADVLLFDEPTQGIDVGAQEEIHALIRRLAADGRAVLYISSDLDETVRVSDRVLVMREGRLVAELRGADVSVPTVLGYCFGAEAVTAHRYAKRRSDADSRAGPGDLGTTARLCKEREAGAGRSG